MLVDVVMSASRTLDLLAKMGEGRRNLFDIKN
jgi:hypothetical protein